MLSISHLIIIFIVALVVFGPEKLPELARNLGKIMADLRRMGGELRGSFEENLRELERQALEPAQPHAWAEPPQPPTSSAPPEPPSPAPDEARQSPEIPADGDAKPA